MTDIQRLFLLLLGIATFGLIFLLKPILAPFLVGALLAYLGDPIADRLESWGLGRSLAVAVVFLVMSLLLTVVLVLVVPLLGRQIDAFITRLPEVAQWLESVAVPWLSQWISLPGYELPIDDLKNLLANNWEKAGGFLKVVYGKSDGV